MRAEAKLPGRKWPWVAVAIAALAAVVIAVVVFAPQLGSGPTPEPTGDALPSADPTNADDSEPTGCLGGSERDAEMVLAAQAAAPHTSNGAVEVAAAMVRFAYQYPYPSPDDADAVGEAVVSSTAPASFSDLAAFYATSPNLSGGLVDDGAQWSVSTVPGVWHLESYAGDEASVSIGGALVTETGLSPSLKISSTVALVWEDGSWHVSGLEGQRSTESLFSVGKPLTEGC